ncbi:MAG: GNAT family N-acetyltransferase, partial [Desulfuromonas sp.]
EARGKGIGALLVAYAINAQGATNVDVNEQNGQALGFYQHLGFSVTGRSPVDGQGKPYPLLHMAL